MYSGENFFFKNTKDLILTFPKSSPTLNLYPSPILCLLDTLLLLHSFVLDPLPLLKADSNPPDLPASISFAQEVVISPSGSDGAASSEAADFDQDGRFEFFSIATSSTSDPHFRIYDYRPNTNDFQVINVLSGTEVDSRF